MEPDYTLALEEARRLFDDHRQALESVRDRAVSLLTIGGLAAAFVGGLADHDGAGDLGPALWVAALMFAGTIACCLLILLPRGRFVGQDPLVLIRWVDVRGATKAQMDRALAEKMGGQIEENSETLTWYHLVFKVGTVMVVLEVVSLLASLGGL
jgi:hypothetical protein